MGTKNLIAHMISKWTKFIPSLEKQKNQMISLNHLKANLGTLVLAILLQLKSI